MSDCINTSDHFTYAEWKSNQMNVMLAAELDRASAERLTSETKRYLDEIKRSTKELDQMTQFGAQRSKEEFRYWQGELNSKLEQIKMFIADLMSIDRRLDKALDSVRENSHLVNKCVEARNKRQQIYLIYDPPEKSLCKEKATIEGVLAQHCKTKAEVNDQLRLLRKIRYEIEKNLLAKVSAWDVEMADGEIRTKKMAIDNKFFDFPSEGQEDGCHQSKKTCPGFQTRPMEDFGLWISEAKKVFAEGEKQRQNAANLSSMAAFSLTQTREDLVNIKNSTDEAFKERINELRDHKFKMEDHLNKVVKQIQENEATSQLLINQIESTSKRMRLEEIKMDTGVKNPCSSNQSSFHQSLMTEYKKLSDDAEKLKDNLACMQCSFKSLQRRKVEVEGDLKFCAEALLIDDYECLPMRQNIRYFIY